MRALLTLIICGIAPVLWAQEAGTFSNYQNQLFRVNPAMTGFEKFNQISFGFKQPWTSDKSQSGNTFLSYEASFQKKAPNSLKNQGLITSNPDFFDSVTVNNSVYSKKHGVSAYVQNRNSGMFNFTELKLAYAYHLPVSKKGFLSMGTWVGILREKIDSENLTVRDPDNDQLYQRITRNTDPENYFQFNLGLTYYTDRFYIGASGNPVFSKSISDINNFQETETLAYSMQLGYQIPMSPNMVLALDGMGFQTQNEILGYRGQVKAIIKDRVSFGGSYDHNQNIAALFGLWYKNIGFKYAYDIFSKDNRIYERNTHEFVLNIKLSKPEVQPRLW